MQDNEKILYVDMKELYANGGDLWFREDHDIEEFPEYYSKKLVAAYRNMKAGKRNAEQKFRQIASREISKTYCETLVERCKNNSSPNRKNDTVFKIKDILIESLGTVGIVIYYALSLVIWFTPFAFSSFPNFWITFLIGMLLLIPGIQDITGFFLWWYSFGTVMSQQPDGWTIFYICILVIYVLTTLLPFAIRLILNIVSLVSEKIFKK